MSFIAVDIDGTIADVTHRLHFLEKKDWDSFYLSCDFDTPINWVCDLVSIFKNHFDDIVFITGRAEMSRRKTSEWIQTNLNISHPDIFMRVGGDKRHDTIVKPIQMKIAEKHFGKCEFIIEDRNSMVKKWRELGYDVLQCAEGNF